MSWIRSRKGSITVFVCIIFSSIMLVTMMFISLSAERAAQSYGSAVLNLAGRSIISEFDEQLKDRYGIVAFYGETSEMEEKIEGYADYSLENNRFIEIRDVDVSLSECSLLNVDLFREQVTEDGITKLKSERQPGKVLEGERTLRSSRTINALPSYGQKLDTPGIKALYDLLKEHPDGEGIIKKGTKTYLTNEYIQQYFNSCAYRVNDKETFYRGEIEYILEGEMSDAENLEKVEKDIKELRVLLNSLYLWGSEKRKAEALAAAEAITPGPAAVATQTVIMEEWALLEAKNDIKILKDGGFVPFLKNDSSWKMDIDLLDVPDVKKKDGEKEGPSYDDYLKVLLYCLDDSTKYLRMMDLVQINLQGTYFAEFSIRDMYTGFEFSAEVNGRRFSYNEKY